MKNEDQPLPLIELPISKHYVDHAFTGKAPCIICNREVKNPKFWIHIVDGGTKIIDPNQKWSDPNSDLGLHPVGSDCIRKHPQIRPYVVKDE